MQVLSFKYHSHQAVCCMFGFISYVLHGFYELGKVLILGSVLQIVTSVLIEFVDL
jgi:hypothetical protein